MMRPVKQQRKGKSYLQGVLRDGVSPFAGRGAVCRLLGIPGSTGKGHYQSQLKIPLSLHYLLNHNAYQPHQLESSPKSPVMPNMPDYQKPTAFVPDILPESDARFETRKTDHPVNPQPGIATEMEETPNTDVRFDKPSAVKKAAEKPVVENFIEAAEGSEKGKQIPSSEPRAEAQKQIKTAQKPADPYAFIRQLGKQLEAENFGETKSGNKKIGADKEDKAVHHAKPADTGRRNPDITHLTVPTMNVSSDKPASTVPPSIGPDMVSDSAEHSSQQISETQLQASGLEQVYQKQNIRSQKYAPLIEHRKQMPAVDHSQSRRESAEHLAKQAVHMQSVSLPKRHKNTQDKATAQNEAGTSKANKAAKRTVQTVRRRLVKRQPAANAFLERSYLGRTHLRIFR